VIRTAGNVARTINLERRLYEGEPTKGNLLDFLENLKQALLSLMAIGVFHMYCITAITNSKSIAFGNYLIETLKTYNLVKFRKANYPFKAKTTTTKTKTKLTREQLFCSSPNNRR